MRRPLRSKTPDRNPGVSTDSVPAPILGWNTRDSIAAMDPAYATVLDNWFPQQTQVVSRPGANDWATGISGEVNSLLVYNGPVDSEMFAVSAAGFYDVTASGVVGAPVVTPTLPAQWNYVNFTTAGPVSYLVAVSANVANNVYVYDGTTWTLVDAVSTPAITGVNTDTLKAVEIFKERLWFLERSSMTAWFLPVRAFGAATAFPLGAIFRRGGELSAIGTWTVDGGNGIDDLLVFVTSKGEAAVYKGTDPTSAATFALVGVYYIGEPVGHRSLIKFGGDLLYLSSSGIGTFSKLLQSSSINREQLLSNVIETAFVNAIESSRNLFGWQPIQYKPASALIVNAPYQVGFAKQFVMNSVSGAWCSFSGWNAHCFDVFNDQLYMGLNGKVAKAWDGASDFGANIVCGCQTAYNYFGARGQQKQWTLYRPQFAFDGSGPITIGIGLSVDFATSSHLSNTQGGGTPGYLWDLAIWDSAIWSGDGVIGTWRSVASPPGYCASFRIQISTNSLSVSWMATDYLFKPCTLGAL